ncbi:hypothetical protein N7528_004683 [Penicillium herquei]|nr:hypothetical protein N7528_004683 [Penicillium herquei]
MFEQAWPLPSPAAASVRAGVVVKKSPSLISHVKLMFEVGHYYGPARRAPAAPATPAAAGAAPAAAEAAPVSGDEAPEVKKEEEEDPAGRS